MLFKIAFRNILRNGRRSLMTASAVAVGAMALLLFGEYMQFIVLGVETSVVARTGHLSVFHGGYSNFGAGNPVAYSISGYRNVIKLVVNDPALKPMLRVVTPSVTMYGIAGNPAVDASKTFFGVGVVPSDRERMIHWDDYSFYKVSPVVACTFHYGMSDGDTTHSIVGVGVARMLSLDVPTLAGRCATERELAWFVRPGRKMPSINLLAGTTEGAPNIVSLLVREARTQGFKEIDDMYVGMDLAVAQQLLYGGGEHKAVSIVIQLEHTADVAKARTLLNQLFARNKLDLEVRDFTQLQPQYNQIVGLFQAIFAFIVVILGVIVLFTVVNTMGMSVMERINEIGTARAMGVRRKGIRRQFLIEGFLLGGIGATVGIALGIAVAYWFNRAGFRWQPPGQAISVPLLMLTIGVWRLQFAIWLGLVVTATLAALVPANRAARMKVVDALRHA
jgi:putative ABC transport system permease protein